MKKITFLAVVLALGATSMESCKKDYTCKCTKTYTASSSTTTVDDGLYTYDDTRKRAEDKCNNQESTGSDIQGSYTRNCDIQ
jgi:hypothetical protein